MVGGIQRNLGGMGERRKRLRGFVELERWRVVPTDGSELQPVQCMVLAGEAKNIQCNGMADACSRVHERTVGRFRPSGPSLYERKRSICRSTLTPERQREAL